VNRRRCAVLTEAASLGLKAPDLQPGELGLWLCKSQDPEELTGSLSESELTRMQLLAPGAGRRNFATGHLLMAHAVQSQGPGLWVSQRCHRCGRQGHGQPTVVSSGRRAGWWVSLSRSSSICAVALASAPVGVDVELVDRVSAADIAHVLTDREWGAASHPALCPGDLAARLWCVKEALGKAKGCGLEGAERLDMLDVVDEASRRPESWVHWRGWSLMIFDGRDSHIGALAVRGGPLHVRVLRLS